MKFKKSYESEEISYTIFVLWLEKKEEDVVVSTIPNSFSEMQPKEDFNLSFSCLCTSPPDPSRDFVPPLGMTLDRLQTVCYGGIFYPTTRDLWS